MTSTIKRAKCLSGSHSSTDGGRRYAVSRSIVRKLSNRIPPSDEERSNQCADSTDRKSTRLNSSHQIISYAVFCLKKKTQTDPRQQNTPEQEHTEDDRDSR